MATDTKKRRDRRRERPRDPLWPGRRAEIQGQVMAQCTRTQETLARVLSLSEPWISRLVNGHPAVARYLEWVAKAQRSKAAHAGPLMVAPLVEAQRVVAEELADAELDVALDAALEIEQERENEENMATCRRLLARARGCEDPEDVAEAERELLFAFIGSLAVQAEAAAYLMERERRRMRVH